MELTRQVLILAFEAGTMSREQTRAEAKPLGLPPLEGSADLEMPFWMPPMALARIVFRDMECVRFFEPKAGIGSSTRCPLEQRPL